MVIELGIAALVPPSVMAVAVVLEHVEEAMDAAIRAAKRPDTDAARPDRVPAAEQGFARPG